MNGDKRERTIMQAAFADLVGRAGITTGPEGFRVDVFDGVIVFGRLGQIGNVEHDNPYRKAVTTAAGGRKANAASRAGVVVVAGYGSWLVLPPWKNPASTNSPTRPRENRPIAGDVAAAVTIRSNPNGL
jgi:hypothetical protein